MKRGSNFTTTNNV